MNDILTLEFSATDCCKNVYGNDQLSPLPRMSIGLFYNCVIIVYLPSTSEYGRKFIQCNQIHQCHVALLQVNGHQNFHVSKQN